MGVLNNWDAVIINLHQTIHSFSELLIRFSVVGEAGAFTSSHVGKRICHRFIMKLIHSAITYVHISSFLQHLKLTSHLCHWTEARVFGENKLKRERPQLADAGWLKPGTLLLWGTGANHCTTTSNLHESWLSNDREWSLVSCNLMNCWFLHKKKGNLK